MSKMGAKLPSDIYDICQTAAEVNACSLYGILIEEDPLTISVLIDSDSTTTIKQCEQILKQIQLTWPNKYSKLLENYFLEVSSAGIERPLFEAQHFNSALGHKISLSFTLDNKTKKAVGTLESVNNDEHSITVSIKNTSQTIPLNALIKCHISSDLKV